MSTWGGHGLRGSTLEDMINRTNDAYRQHKLALIQKVPTPITPIEMNKNRQITLAYFDQKSTVDYIGVVQKIPVCFDAKECAVETFPLQNVHEHQISFMKDFEEQGGCAFFVLFYTERDEMYYLPFREMLRFWERMKNGGRKSFRFEELEDVYPLKRSGEFLCHYLEGLSEDLDSRDGED
ncbi:MAG: Holliday junction resolvase RecU [Eubacteriales bacterium]|nr:Holliday junction resolvase RecU [Eubacteriales bacterium]